MSAVEPDLAREFLQDARQMVNEFSGTLSVGIKDPRISVLLPFGAMHSLIVSKQL
jgi:hypothetical protein